MEFFKTERGKILSYGIHEHNSGLGIAKNYISLVNILLEKESIILSGDEETKKLFKDSILKIRESLNKCQSSVDYIYENIKKLEPED